MYFFLLPTSTPAGATAQPRSLTERESFWTIHRGVIPSPLPIPLRCCSGCRGVLGQCPNHTLGQRLDPPRRSARRQPGDALRPSRPWALLAGARPPLHPQKILIGSGRRVGRRREPDLGSPAYRDRQHILCLARRLHENVKLVRQGLSSRLAISLPIFVDSSLGRSANRG